MISRFFRLNWIQIKFAFIVCSMAFTALVWIVFIIMWITKNPEDLKDIIVVTLFSSIIFPIFIILLGFFGWIFEIRIIKRNLRDYPFNEIEKLGFVSRFTNFKNKWNLTQEIFESKINDFIVQCVVDGQEPKMIQFIFLVEHEKFSKKEYYKMYDILKEEGGYFDFRGISKKYKLKEHRLNSIYKLETDLKKFANILIKNGFKRIIARP